MRNPILGMVPRDLSNAKATILGATLGAIPGISGNARERFSFAPAFSELFFKELGWSPRARQTPLVNPLVFTMYLVCTLLMQTGESLEVLW